MTIQQAIFYGFSAWVGRVDDETRCGFWSMHPAEVLFDPILLIPVDLSRTPSAVFKGKIDPDEVQVDDFKDGPKGGATTIGPSFPDGKTTGVVYLAKAYYDRLRQEIRPVLKPSFCPNRPTSVVYGKDPKDPRAGARYHSYHAKIAGPGQNKSTLVTVHQNGASGATIQHAFDLASAECDRHLDDGGMTEIATGKKDEGLLFIEIALARKIGLEPLKNPLSCGLDYLSRPRHLPRGGPVDGVVRARELRL